jgi:hypothetical protein
MSAQTSPSAGIIGLYKYKKKLLAHYYNRHAVKILITFLMLNVKRRIKFKLLPGPLLRIKGPFVCGSCWHCHLLEAFGLPYNNHYLE